MAKKPSHAEYLFREMGRKHRQLFVPKRLSEVVFKLWAQPNGPDQPMLQQLRSRANHWADMAASGALDHKETALDAEFLRILFAEGLGYIPRGDSTAAFQLDRQFTVEGCGTADGALGLFNVGMQQRPIAVIECKGASTDLDHDKFSGRTPVQQLWGYLNELPDTPWGILSNYVTIRLYHRDATPRAYHEWTVKDFRDFDRIKELAYVLGPDGLLGKPPLQKPRADAVLELSQVVQREVGDELYDYYSIQREHLIDALISQYRYSTEDAIRAAQLLLDRVVFIAFCQYRGLLPARLLENTWKNVAPLARATNPRWQNFLDTFHAIDKGHRSLDLTTGYNGGLFRRDPLVDDLQLEDEPFTTVFKQIGDYDFSEQGEVNVDVLGHLFEKSITELEKKKAVGLFGPQPAGVTRAQMPKSAERKRFGIYYTPPAYTRFIVDKTIGRLFEERVNTTDDPEARILALRKLKVVDMACGSGAFLIAGYDAFEEAYEGVVHLLHTAGKPDRAREVSREYPGWILADNLYGMDLSAEAVEITRLALWIRSARKGVALSDLSHNIVCGNSLVTDPNIHARAKVWQDVFPEVFAQGGFDAVIGNPPWERIKQQKREFFAFVPEVLLESNAEAARQLIDSFEQARPELHGKWQAALDRAAAMSEYVRASGRFPLTATGDVNYAMLFAELSRHLVAPDGLIGLLVPSGIATDSTTKHFFGDLMDRKALCALYDFENKKYVFTDVDARFKFSVLLMNGSSRQTEAADFVFFAHAIEDLDGKDRHITLTARDLKLLNPTTRTCPIFRSRFDCELTKRMYRNVPSLVDKSRKAGGNPWGIRFWTMFHQSGDAELFHDADHWKAQGFRPDGTALRKGRALAIPLYEAKMVQAYDHRACSVFTDANNWLRHGQTEDTSLVEHQNPEFGVLPRWWVDAESVATALQSRERPAYLAYKDVTSSTNQRTMIAMYLPRAAATHPLPFVITDVPPRRECCLLANFNALPYDYIARQKVGGLHLSNFIVEQLPTFPPHAYDEKCPWDKKQTLEKWISERVLKLTCTADDMRPLAEAAGFKEGVHRWNEAERAQLRAELDAAYFLLYGFTTDEINDVLDGFNGVVKEDEAHGRPGPTRKAIIEAFATLNAR